MIRILPPVDCFALEIFVNLLIDQYGFYPEGVYIFERESRDDECWSVKFIGFTVPEEWSKYHEYKFWDYNYWYFVPPTTTPPINNLNYGGELQSSLLFIVV